VRLDRIRKLFNLAADQAGTPEGEAAARIARRLLVERSVSLAELSEEERAATDPFERREILLGGPAHWRCVLVCAVAAHCDCAAGYLPGRGKARLYGRRGAVEVAEYLFVVLSRALTRERAYHLVTEARGLDPAAQERSASDFCRSAIFALQLRMQEIREQEQGERPEVTALVSAQSAGLWRWMREQGVSQRVDAPFPWAMSESGVKAGYRLPLVPSVEDGLAETTRRARG